MALAARMFDTRAVVVMPDDAVGVKLSATRTYGAKVLQQGQTPHDRKARAEVLARERGLTMVPPYEDPRILIGQGTTLIEILAQAPKVEVLLVPVGGGGLLGGICAAARAYRPGLTIYGAEPEIADDWARSIEAGKIVSIESADTIADGLRSLEPGEVPFPARCRSRLCARWCRASFVSARTRSAKPCICCLRAPSSWPSPPARWPPPPPSSTVRHSGAARS